MRALLLLAAWLPCAAGRLAQARRREADAWRAGALRGGPDAAGAEDDPGSMAVPPSDGIAAYLTAVRASGVKLPSEEDLAAAALGAPAPNATAEALLPRRTVVVARFDEDVGWLRGLPKNVEAVVYQSKDERGQRFVENVGNEAAKYLTYITEYYHELPETVAFVQAGRQDWHDPFPKDATLRAWQWGAAAQLGGIKFLPTSAPCLVEDSEQLAPHPRPTAPPGEACGDVVEHSPKQMRTIREVWPSVFQQELGPLPQRWMTHCCAQFEATRDAIQQHPLDFYQGLLEWVKQHDRELLESDHAGSVERNHDPERRDAGHVLEPLWVLLFAQPAGRVVLPRLPAAESAASGPA